jgi:hypothetical protein
MLRIVVIKPFDCPYRESVAGNYYCGHPIKALRYCTWTNETPSGCPMTYLDIRMLKLKKIIDVNRIKNKSK